MNVLRILAPLCALALTGTAHGQSKAPVFPTKPIRLVAPTSAGGGNDLSLIHI